MAIPRRTWDSSIVIGYLAGYPDFKTECDLIIDSAVKGDCEILVSTIAEVEAAYLVGYSDEDSEAKIKEFFSRSYVVVAAYDQPVAAAARRLIRQGKAQQRKLSSHDAIHLATCEVHHIPILETTDPDLLRWNQIIGNPPIIVRKPVFEGQRPLI